MAKFTELKVAPEHEDLVLAAMSEVHTSSSGVIWGRSARYWNTQIKKIGVGEFTLSGGNNAERAIIIESINDEIKRRAAAAPATASQKQVAFLRRLVSEDPALAATFGLADIDIATLSKSEASRAIDNMLAEH